MTQTTSSLAALRPVLHDAIQEAAALALPFFRQGDQTSARVWSKAGGSPVTEADVAVDTFLKIRLSQIEPRAAWLSEETSDDPVRLGHDFVWIVDPIDGTRAFLSGHPDWSIAVALLARGEPVLGGVFAPATEQFYEAVAGEGATLNGAPIRVAPQATLEGARVTGPKPMQDRLLDGAARLGPRPSVTVVDRVPSLALRLARVAEGRIDLGLVSRDARDWDLAGADLIVREAGGVVCDLQGRPAVYNRPEPRHGELIAVPLPLRDPALAALEA
ncbi:inositol monophosphatase [Methylorubrum extorquens]|uniref:inositol monophosphatase family protein n=1 Tax=Methylorubrum extorquens TaxID=408 RepID=UPI0022388719|nr:inositol monophosphatase [Methylorubrum extorquens]UYW27060.1 inositol monophosphatase [Methylorubrum extorquens]